MAMIPMQHQATPTVKYVEMQGSLTISAYTGATGTGYVTYTNTSDAIKGKLFAGFQLYGTAGKKLAANTAIITDTGATLTVVNNSDSSQTMTAAPRIYYYD